MGKKKKKQQTTFQATNGEPSHVVNGDSKSVSYSVSDLMERVDQYIENFEFELAFKFCEKALEIEPSNTNVLETTGNVCAENGDIDKAKEFFKKAIEIEPDSGHVKYLYLGQVSEGHDAVSYYNKAISILKAKYEFLDNNKESAEEQNIEKESTKRDISNVYCSLAEIYMTDCCMEEDAQTLCENYCKEAIENDEKNPDSYIVMSNFLLSSNNIEQATENILRLFELWNSLTKNNLDNIPNLISYEIRVSLIKLLIEVECFENVSNVVDQLIEENEDDIRIWYYLGLAKHFLMQLDKNNDNPRFYLEKALELFEKTGYEDDEMKQHIEEILETCPLEDEMPIIEEEELDEIESEEENMEED